MQESSITMKRKQIQDEVKAGGLYITEFIRGFFGKNNEGNAMLENMGLSDEVVPFSVALFLQNGEIQWKDSDGMVAYITYRFKPGMLECYGAYKGKHKTSRLFLEWNHYEDKETITRLESEAIGDLCMRCILDNL